MAKEKMSLPQPYSVRIGIWNTPTAERGPKVSMPMRQPAAMISSGGNLLGVKGAPLPAIGAAMSLVPPVSADSGSKRH